MASACRAADVTTPTVELKYESSAGQQRPTIERVEYENGGHQLLPDAHGTESSAEYGPPPVGETHVW